jgi:hypothetical protein
MAGGVMPFEFEVVSDSESCDAALQIEGWVLGETALTNSVGKVCWVVSGEKGNLRILACGATNDEAWARLWSHVATGTENGYAP